MTHPAAATRTRELPAVGHHGRRRGSTMMYNTVLVPLDSSKLAEGAMPPARALATRLSWIPSSAAAIRVGQPSTESGPKSSDPHERDASPLHVSIPLVR